MLPITANAADAGEQAINFEPLFIYADGAPGEHVTTAIRVRNQTLADASFSIELTDAAESPGASTAFDFVEIGSARRGAGDWIDVGSATFELRAGTERSIPVRIDIPDDAAAGGHYGGVVFAIKPTTASGQFDVSYTAGTPVLITVDGAFKHDLRVRVRADDRWRFNGGRAGWTVELRNEGDVHEVFSGRLRLDSMVSGTASTALWPGILLPGERRTEHVEFEVRSAPDIYRTRVRVEREGADAVVAKSSRMVVLPLWVLLVLGAAFVVVWLRVRASRRRRAWRADDSDDGFDPAG